MTCLEHGRTDAPLGQMVKYGCVMFLKPHPTHSYARLITLLVSIVEVRLLRVCDVSIIILASDLVKHNVLHCRILIPNQRLLRIVQRRLHF